MIVDADPGDECDRSPSRHWRTCDLCGGKLEVGAAAAVPVPLGIAEMSPLALNEIASSARLLPEYESLIVCDSCLPLAHAFRRERQHRWCRPGELR